MKPLDFYELATRLASGGQPAELRSATSRAYYAAFHVVHDFLRSIGISLIMAPESHAKVCYILENSGDAELSEAGRVLSSLRRERNLADYDLTKRQAESAKVVGNNIRYAKDIIDCIDGNSSDGKKPAAYTAIREYAKRVLGINVT